MRSESLGALESRCAAAHSNNGTTCVGGESHSTSSEQASATASEQRAPRAASRSHSSVSNSFIRASLVHEPRAAVALVRSPDGIHRGRQGASLRGMVGPGRQQLEQCLCLERRSRRASGAPGQRWLRAHSGARTGRYAWRGSSRYSSWWKLITGSDSSETGSSRKGKGTTHAHLALVFAREAHLSR